MEAIHSYSEKVSLIIKECELVLKSIDPQSVEQLLDEIEKADKVFVVGVGRVLLSLQAIAKRLNHLDIKTYCVGQIDEPPISEKDLLLVGSSSGETIIPVSIARKAHELCARIGYMGASPDSTVRKIADFYVQIPTRRSNDSSAVIISQQPMTTLFEQVLLLFGDAITLMLMERKGLKEKDVLLKHANLE